MYDKCMQTAEFLKEKGFDKATYGMIFGSGLGNIEEYEVIDKIAYADIPNFPVSTVDGHNGFLIYGKVKDVYFIAQQGRFHYYEGYSGDEIIFGVRVMKMLGIHTLFVSNAVGGLNQTYQVGDIMIMEDHINLLPNPLIGANDLRFGARFPDMTHPYDAELVKKATIISALNSMQLKKGVYLSSTGPSFETPAECNFFRIIGADVVGMSTTSETIAARHMNMKVFGVSVITNEAHNFAKDFMNSGKDVIEEGEKAAKKVGKLFAKLMVDAS